ncbi:hypothetical protein EYF80_040908 [Liparis tanakae]|uniref:Uncharacterized protein n=1 Tax=Liparis tanakae TaxID=230148 RepID=A0A4Z2G6Y7_9TELE|nr:hypothetical protein EYF80_040908 [Liparis tanakae]
MRLALLQPAVSGSRRLLSPSAAGRRADTYPEFPHLQQQNRQTRKAMMRIPPNTDKSLGSLSYLGQVRKSERRRSADPGEAGAKRWRPGNPSSSRGDADYSKRSC